MRRDTTYGYVAKTPPLVCVWPEPETESRYHTRPSLSGKKREAWRDEAVYTVSTRGGESIIRTIAACGSRHGINMGSDAPRTLGGSIHGRSEDTVHLRSSISREVSMNLETDRRTPPDVVVARAMPLVCDAREPHVRDRSHDSSRLAGPRRSGTCGSRSSRHAALAHTRSPVWHRPIVRRPPVL